MRKIFSLLAMVLVFSGCSKDEAPSVSLIGKWDLIKVENYQNNELVYTEIDQDENISCPDYTEFKSNGTIEDIKKDEICAITSTNSNFTYVGNIITNTESGEKLTVINLTNTDMTIALSVTDEDIVIDNVKVYYKKLN